MPGPEPGCQSKRLLPALDQHRLSRPQVLGVGHRCRPLRDAGPDSAGSLGRWGASGVPWAGRGAFRVPLASRRPIPDEAAWPDPGLLWHIGV